MFLTPQWQAALSTVIEENRHDLPALLTTCYKVDQSIGCWPQLLVDLQNLKEPIYPVYEMSPSPVERATKATAIEDKILGISSVILAEYTKYKESITKDGLITEVLDPDSTIGARYEFGTVETAQLLLSYLGLIITFNRIKFELATIRGDQVADLEVENKALSQEVWKCLPYIKDLGPIALILFAWPMTLALEAGNRAEKLLVLQTFLELDKYKQRLPTDLEELEEVILSTGRVHLGRATMGDLQRFSCRV